MSRKHVTDAMVVRAYALYHAIINGRIVVEKSEGTIWPYTILMAATGQPFKVCYRAMERAEEHGLIDCGVSLRSGWLTDKGKDMFLAESGAPYNVHMRAGDAVSSDNSHS